MIRHVLGVAVIAARRDFLAPDPRVERVIAPFNFAVLSHFNNSVFKGSHNGICRRDYLQGSILQQGKARTSPDAKTNWATMLRS
jgi:hypothetical protein